MGSVVGCGAADQSHTPASQEKVIIGDNDFVKINPTTESLSGITEAIGAMVRGCTATHIGNGIVITAGHCLPTYDCSATDYDVVWGYTDSQRGIGRSQCVEVIAKELSNARDYAILRYDPVPPAQLDVELSGKPQKGSLMTIFSHPRLRTLENSGWCQVGGNIATSEKFTYTCDTEGGSSGAAILDRNFRVVGIHNLGANYQQYNAGTYITSTPLASILR